MSQAAYSPTIEFQMYYRFDERTGNRILYRVLTPLRVMSPLGGNFYQTLDDKYFTKSGEHRQSIVFKGKRYFICYSS